MDYSLIILLLIVTLGCWGFWSLVFKLIRKWINPEDLKQLVEIAKAKNENKDLEIDRLQGDVKYLNDEIQTLIISNEAQDEHINALLIEIAQLKNPDEQNRSRHIPSNVKREDGGETRANV